MRPHEVPIAFLKQRHGPGASRDLTTIYSPDRGQRPLTADYVGDCPECNAFVEVFSKGDEWRQVMGKVVAYAHEVRQTNSKKEIWLVSVDLHRDPDWLDWYRRIIDIARSMLVEDVRGRIKYFDFDTGSSAFRPMEPRSL